MKNEATIIRASLPSFLIKSLPRDIIAEHEAYLGKRGRLAEEIRLRVGRRIEFCYRGTSIFCGSILTSKEIQDIFYRLCGASVYAHEESVCRGYIRAEGGIRIGVCGRAGVRGGRIDAVYDISSINIRLPCASPPSYSELSEQFLKGEGGMLLISPPGVGKTTVLRSLICELSEKREKKLAVIDSAGELAPTRFGTEMRLDVLDGYPRAEGIEIAVRTLSPEIIVCDEIGDKRDADAILGAANCGVSFIASTHGNSFADTLKRIGIKELHDAEVFSSYVTLTRKMGEAKCNFSITGRKDLN